MTLKATWTLALKDSTNKFAQAYKAWTDVLFKEAQGGSKAAKDAIVIQRLKLSGLYKGQKFTEYCKFKSDFGPMLDKLETMVKANADADKKVAKLKLKDILKSPKLLGIFKHYCENDGRIDEVYAFVVGGAKMKPEVVYDTFLKNGAKMLLNEDDGVRTLWKNMHATKNWKDAPTSMKDMMQRQYQYLDDGVAKCVKHAVYAKFLRKECGGSDPAAIEKAGDKCLAVAFEHVKEVQGYGKRWGQMKPDFWTPLLKALEEIIKGVNDAKKA